MPQLSTWNAGQLACLGILAGSLGPAIGSQPVDKQNQYTAPDSQQHAANIKSGDVAKPKLCTEEPTDDSPNNAQNDGSDDPAGSPTRQKKPGYRSRDQSEQGP